MITSTSAAQAAVVREPVPRDVLVKGNHLSNVVPWYPASPQVNDIALGEINLPLDGKLLRNKVPHIIPKWATKRPRDTSNGASGVAVTINGEQVYPYLGRCRMWAHSKPHSAGRSEVDAPQWSASEHYMLFLDDATLKPGLALRDVNSKEVLSVVLASRGWAVSDRERSLRVGRAVLVQPGATLEVVELQCATSAPS